MLKLTFIALFFIFNFLPVLALDANQYPYYKRIITPQSIGEPAIVKLDYQVLNYMKPDSSDLRIAEDGQEIPLKVIVTPVEEVAHKGSITAVSSTRANFRGVNFDASNLIDGDYSSNDNAYFQIDSITDPNYAWFIIDLKAAVLTDKAKIWSLNNDYTWTDVQIEGSDDGQNWKIIKSRTKYRVSDTRTVTYPPVEFRYLKFSFWHTQS